MIKSKFIRTVLLVALAATLVCSLALAACSSSNTWDVSADSSSSVTAKLVKTSTGYSLNISGKGKMKDFETLADVPWRNQIKLVNSVTVTPGVTYIGKNAFDGANIDYIVLPSTVTAVGANFVGDKTKVFAHSADVQCGSDCDLYVYSQETITTNDRYWQSDKSSGDIVDDGEVLGGTSGKYWHYGTDDRKYTPKQRCCLSATASPTATALWSTVAACRGYSTTLRRTSDLLRKPTLLRDRGGTWITTQNRRTNAASK